HGIRNQRRAWPGALCRQSMVRAQAEVEHQPENSRWLQNRVIGLSSRVSERRLDVIRLKVRKILQDFIVRYPFGENTENIGDTDEHPTNTWPPAALARLDCDSLQKLH